MKWTLSGGLLDFESRAQVMGGVDDAGAPQTASLGWNSVPVFTREGYLNAGFWKLPLLRPPIDATAPASQRQPVRS